MASDAVTFDGATRRFRGSQSVGPISTSLRAGEVLGLIGANGSGKTTIFKMAVGLEQVDAGRIDILGQPVEYGTLPEATTALIEGPAFYHHLSARENLVLAADGRADRLDRVNDTLEQVGLDGVGAKHVGAFSQGMKQRLGIARILISAPKVVFLDEPTNGLDPGGIVWVRELITRFAAEGMAVAVSSHLLDELESVATRVLVLSNGEVVGDGELSVLLDKYTSLEELYHEKSRR